ncbi:MAG: guanylate kinase [Oscillospiraceae bacterium]|jgi:guanylate kinase|nr:guanylate kinase [Oscillospiraceae bacterium]
MNNKGLLIVVSGPSGSGKGTVLKQLLRTDDNLFYSISATTRSPRERENHGEHYYFLEKQDFLDRIKNDGMLEYACYCDNYYGTPKDEVYQKLEMGKDVILEIETQGAMQIKEKCPEAIFVFIMPPSMPELRRRLTDRKTEDLETVEKRLSTAICEINLAYEYDYVVVNDTVSDAVEKLRAIILANKNSKNKMKKFIDEVLNYA